MKTMKCSQLGGPDSCNEEFHAESFDEMAAKSQTHGKEMFEKGDEAHLQAMQDMKNKMQDPEAVKSWMEEKRKEFDELPEDD